MLQKMREHSQSTATKSSAGSAYYRVYDVWLRRVRSVHEDRIRRRPKSMALKISQAQLAMETDRKATDPGADG